MCGPWSWRGPPMHPSYWCCPGHWHPPYWYRVSAEEELARIAKRIDELKKR
ncbi:MAG: hypothetical protein ACE5OY_02170 [Candidatus Bathyarchaeia archaeon]